MKVATALIAGAILGAVIVIITYFYLSSREAGDETLTLSFSEAEIQEKIGKDFPKDEKILDYIPVVIEEPTVKFLGDSERVQLSVKAILSIPFVTSEEVIGVFTSSIRYESEDKTLRISDLTVESIRTSRLPEKFEEPIRLALTAAARKYLDDHIVHQIKPKDIPRAMAEMLLQKIKIRSGRLEVILGL